MKLKSKLQRKYNVPDTQLPLHKNLGFAAMEQYKLLRTNLSFVLPEDVKCPVIGVTSSGRGDGKSTTSVNLSYVLAEAKKRVLLIDCDLRLPSIAKKMGIHSTPGLTNLLVEYNEESLEKYRSKVLENWYIIPSGSLPPNPSELLGSQKMQKLLSALSEQFDYIVLDLPPVSVVSDALAVAKLVTGMILVVRQDYTDKKDLEICVRHLDLSGVNVIGCVINDNKDKALGRARRYSGHYHYAYGEEKKNSKRHSAV